MSQSRKNSFERYLKITRILSESSISKYARQAHSRIYKDLGISFYEVESMEELHQLLNDVRQMESLMEKNPRRMYSSAVSNYIKFMAYELEKTYLNQEIEYNHIVEEELKHVDSFTVESNQKMEPASPAKLSFESKLLYRRSGKVAAEAILKNNYLCQINSNHLYFTSKATNRNYVEAHHIIPISTQALFHNGIDCVPNIASLCPTCHRQIHYGLDNDREEMLEILWDNNYRDIERVGIELKFEELLQMY